MPCVYNLMYSPFPHTCEISIQINKKNITTTPMVDKASQPQHYQCLLLDFFFSFGCATAHGSSQARDQTHTTEAAQAFAWQCWCLTHCATRELGNWTVLCWGGVGLGDCLLHCRMFSSTLNIVVFYPLDASGNPLPNITTKDVSPNLSNIPGD